ncbi:MAG TPA: hypothetical protein ENG55_01700, partial [Candidatus Omnitrophica bacterium]|nr:hypothetical protein [Candidatus Omnitrophota bacterium]
GNMATRWGSEFKDNQWLKIDLEEPRTISGLTLWWEDAYASRYKILLSEDGSTWIDVYEEKNGDGNSDEIYFRPQEARFIKIHCIKRATGWGNSLWEVKIKREDEYPVIEASSYRGKNLPSNIMDGDVKTFWQTDEALPQWIEVDLRRKKDLGGFLIDWGEVYATDYEILTSLDKKDWRSVYGVECSNGGKDLIYIDPTRARYIKVVCKDSNNKGVSLGELIIKGKDEHATPQRIYEVLADESPGGYFPEWIYKKQVYWTITGVEGDEKESLISTNGTIEPDKESFTIMPYIYVDNHLVTASDCKVSQELEEGYLPIPEVRWDYKGLILNQKMFTHGKRGASSTYVYYELINNTSSSKKGSIYLTIRPIQLNPPWQHGRMPRISNIEFVSGKIDKVRINNKDDIIFLNKPDGFGATIFKASDIISYVAGNRLPDEDYVTDVKGLASCAIRFNFDLSPASKKDIYFVLPLYQKDIEVVKNQEEFNRALEETRDFWKAKLSAIKIDIPQKELINVLRANLAYLLINKDNAALQPGPRNYDRSWMRDGAVMCAALLRGGFYKEVKDYLDWVSRLQRSNGEIPC